MKTPHRLTAKYTALIKSGTMTKSEINAMRKALGYCSKLPSEEKQKIMDALSGRKIRITEEHSNQGINYLKRLAFKTNGEPRRTKNFPFTAHDLETLNNFKEFRLVGLDEIPNNYGEPFGYNSIWRVYSRTRGEYFDYVQGHWSDLHIIDRGFKKGTL